MREVQTNPEPIEVEARELSEITGDIIALLEAGIPREEIRLFAGQPKDWGGERWAPGHYYCGVLVV